MKNVCIPNEKYESAILYDNILFNNANDMIQFCSLDGKISRVNKKWVEIMGYDEQSVSSMSILDIVHSDHRKQCLMLFERIKEGENITSYRTVFVSSTGESIDVEINASPVYIDGRIQFAMAIIRDVRESVSMLREMSSLSDEMTKYFENAPIGAVILNVNGEIIKVNRKMQSVTGYNAAELAEKGVFEPIIREIANRPEGITEHDGRTEIMAADGRLTEIAYNISKFEHGRVLLFCRDITSEVRMNDRLKSSLQATERIIEKMPVGIMLVGNDKKIRMMNDEGSRITGYTESELLGKACNDFVCTAMCNQCPVLDLHQSVDSSEKFVVAKTGKQIPVLKTVIPISINNENLLLEAFTDISANVAAEEAAREQQLTDSLRADIWGIALSTGDEEQMMNRILNKIKLFLHGETVTYASKQTDSDDYEVLYETENENVMKSVGLIIPGFIVRMSPFNEAIIFTEGEIEPEMKDIIEPMMKKHGFSSIMTAHIADADEIIGFLTIGSTDGRKWNETERNMIKEVSKILSIRLRQIRSEHMLARSERDYKSIFDNLHDIYFRTDEAGTVLMLSPSVEELTGYRPDEVIGKKASLFYRSDTNRKHMMRKLFRDKYLENYEIEMQSKNGKVKYMIANAHVNKNTDAECYIEGTFTDITHLKELEQELRLSQKRQSIHFQNTPLAVIEWDSDMKVLSWNPAAERIFGYSEKEAVGMSIPEIIVPPGSRDAMRKLAEDMMNGRQRHNINENITKEGKIITCEWYNTALEDDTGHIIGIASAGINITDRIAMQEHIKQLSKAVSQSPVSIVITDTEGTIEYVNPKFIELTGYAAEEIIGKNPSILKGGNKSDKEYSELWDTIKHGNVWKGEFLNRRKDGSLFWESASISPIKDTNGNVTHFIAVKEDISERKRSSEQLETAHRELEIMNKELQKNVDIANQYAIEAEIANSAKSRFLANMSHEIRTPMNGIIGMTDLLLDTELNEEQKEYAKIVQNSSDALLNIINDILDYSKIESGRIELENIQFNMREMLEDMNDIIAIRAQAKGIEYSYFIDKSLPESLHGDPVRLRQILINLLGNAVKFTERGSVEMLIEGVESGKGTTGVRFSVRDTGIGIKRAKLSTIFESFTQADASTTRQFGGTGLGLAISKQLVELMGGKLNVKSIYNEGTVFWFDLQLKTSITGKKADIISKGKTLAKNVLYIDDNETNRRLVRDILRKYGVSYAEAADGKSGLEAIREAFARNERFDAVLIDMIMPQIDGMMLAAKIHEEFPTEDMRLILMTSIAFSGKNRNIEDMGFDAYINKPIKQDRLLEVLYKETTHRKKSMNEDNKKTMNISRKVLVAEDNVTNRKVASMILGKMGHTVKCVENGKLAAEELLTENYDIVLMDLQMPVMDGYEATRSIREAGINTPVIAMTADAMKGTAESCIESGMDDYITKPVKPDELKSAILKWTYSSPQPRTVRNMEQKKSNDLNIELLKSRVGDNEEFIGELLNVFFDEAAEIWVLLKKNSESGQITETGKYAHKLKGAASSVCAEKVQYAAGLIEKAAKEGNTEGIGESINNLKILLDNVSKIIKEEIWKSQTKTN